MLSRTILSYLTLFEYCSVSVWDYIVLIGTISHSLGVVLHRLGYFGLFRHLVNSIWDLNHQFWQYILVFCSLNSAFIMAKESIFPVSNATSLTQSASTIDIVPPPRSFEQYQQLQAFMASTKWEASSDYHSLRFA